MSPRLISCPAALALAAAAACATPGTRPHEMGAAGHEQAAAAEQKEAERHAALYELAERAAEGRCASEGSPCWTSVMTPKGHRKEVERHLAAAAEHRAAGQALAQAEASACAGLTEIDRDMSPFAHREDIEYVAQLFHVQYRLREERVATLLGAQIAFLPVRGLSRERLQRIVNCHLARNAVLGHDVPEMDYCPLVPKDVTAQVLSGGDRYLVNVQSITPASAQEIWTRAQKIGAPEARPVTK